jgi:chromosome segregation ATPase
MAQEKVKSYEEAFDKIQQATKISDIDELVNTFIDAEETNFKLFNRVNSLSNEIERLEETIENLQQEIQNIQGNSVSIDEGKDQINDENADNIGSADSHKDGVSMTLKVGNSERKKILDDLEKKITTASDKIIHFEAKHTESLRVIESLKDGITKILNKVFDPSIKLSYDDVDAAEIDSSTGAKGPSQEQKRQTIVELIDNTGITETNVIQILGEIEQKTDSMIKEYLYLTQTGTADMNININQVTDNDSKEITNQPPQNQNKNFQNLAGLDDKEAQAAALGVGIGAASLQHLVATPQSILDDFSDASDEDEDDHLNV